MWFCLVWCNLIYIYLHASTLILCHHHDHFFHSLFLSSTYSLTLSLSLSFSLSLHWLSIYNYHPYAYFQPLKQSVFVLSAVMYVCVCLVYVCMYVCAHVSYRREISWTICVRVCVCVCKNCSVIVRLDHCNSSYQQLCDTPSHRNSCSVHRSLSPLPSLSLSLFRSQ